MTRWCLALALILSAPILAGEVQDALEEKSLSGPVEATVRLRPAAPTSSC